MSKHDYYLYLNQQMQYCIDASHMICDALNTKNTVDINSSIRTIEELKDNAYQFYCDITDHLSLEFITPLDQHDFLSIMQHIRYMSNELYSSLLLIYMYRVYDIPASLIELSDSLDDCINMVGDSVYDLKSFKKDDSYRVKLRDIKKYEDEMFYIYRKAIEELIRKHYDYKHVLSYHMLYDHFMKCLSLCSSTIDLLAQIIMKNI